MCVFFRDIAEIDYKLIESQRSFLASGYINYFPQPLVLVVASSSSAGNNTDKLFLQNISKSFDHLGFNRSAIFWRYDEEVSTQTQVMVDGWFVHYMTRKNATNMETLIAYMTEVLQVGVLYVDPSSPRIQSINYNDYNTLSRWVWQDPNDHSSSYHEVRESLYAVGFAVVML
jgi:hypothetical protein